MFGKILEKPNYKIYHAVMPIDAIFNFAGPYRFTQEGVCDTPWFDEEAYVRDRNKADGFYDMLTDMISSSGIQVPIAINYNMKHPVSGVSIDGAPICWSSGGDLLYAAKNVGFTKVPCIISDFGDNKQNRTNWIRLETLESIAAYMFNASYKSAVRFTEYGVQYPDMPYPEGFLNEKNIKPFGETIDKTLLIPYVEEKLADPPTKVEKNRVSVQDLSKPDIIPENMNPSLMLRHEQQFETELEKEARLKANEKADAKANRMKAKARTKAEKNGVEYVPTVFHDTWWEEKPTFIYVPPVYEAKILPPKAGETAEEIAAREAKNMAAQGSADRKTILERQRAVAAGLMKETDFPLWEVKETPKIEEAPIFGPAGVLNKTVANRDTVPMDRVFYDVVYTELDPAEIFNYVGPWSFTQPKIRPKTLYATEQKMIDKRNEFDGFYDKLEKSISENGMLDPIVVNYGGGVGDFTIDLLPANIKKVIQVERTSEDGSTKMEDVIVVIPPICMYMGGSRLWVAKKLGLKKIPCIVSDFTRELPNAEKLNTVNEIAAKFVNKPKFLRYTKIGIKYEPGVEE